MRALTDQISEARQSTNGKWVRNTAASPLTAEGPVDESHRGFVPEAEIAGGRMPFTSKEKAAYNSPRPASHVHPVNGIGRAPCWVSQHRTSYSTSSSRESRGALSP